MSKPTTNLCQSDSFPRRSTAVCFLVWRQHLPELFLVLSLLPVQLLRHDLVFLLQLEAVVEDLCSAICRFSVFLQPLFFDLDFFIFGVICF